MAGFNVATRPVTPPRCAPEHAIRLPREEAAELTRLASERRTDVHSILLTQLGPLRKLLRSRIAARLRSNRPPA